MTKIPSYMKDREKRIWLKLLFGNKTVWPKDKPKIERSEWKKVFNKGEYPGLSNYHD